MFKSKKGMLYALLIFIVLMVLDLISTLILGNMAQYLESNWLYPFIGFGGIFLLALMLATCIFYFYNRSEDVVMRFCLISVAVTICVFKIFVIINNVQVYLHPLTIEQAMAVPQEVKNATMINLWWSALIPYLCGILSFWFFSKDHDIQVKKRWLP